MCAGLVNGLSEEAKGAGVPGLEAEAVKCWLMLRIEFVFLSGGIFTFEVELEAEEGSLNGFSSSLAFPLLLLNNRAFKPSLSNTGPGLGNNDTLLNCVVLSIPVLSIPSPSTADEEGRETVSATLGPDIELLRCHFWGRLASGGRPLYDGILCAICWEAWVPWDILLPLLWLYACPAPLLLLRFWVPVLP